MLPQPFRTLQVFSDYYTLLHLPEMGSHSTAATEELVTYRNVSSKVGSTTPADYTTWFTVITTNEYNRLASPTSRDPVFEIGYIPGDLRGANYDKVNLFLEKTTCISYIVYLIIEGVVPNADKFVLLELPVKNLHLFRHIGGHGSDFFDREYVSYLGNTCRISLLPQDHRKVPTEGELHVVQHWDCLGPSELVQWICLGLLVLPQNTG